MSTDSRTLLIVEDDSPLRERLVRAMRDRGFDTIGVPDHTSALDAARQDSPELALVDLRLPGESGLAVIRDLKELDPATVVVVLTGYGSIATAVRSLASNGSTYSASSPTAPGTCRGRRVRWAFIAAPCSASCPSTPADNRELRELRGLPRVEPRAADYEIAAGALDALDETAVSLAA